VQFRNKDVEDAGYPGLGKDALDFGFGGGVAEYVFEDRGGWVEVPRVW
jgi:hypothetical protein